MFRVVMLVTMVGAVAACTAEPVENPPVLGVALPLPLLNAESSDAQRQAVEVAQGQSDVRLVFVGVESTYLAQAQVSIYRVSDDALALSQQVDAPLMLVTLAPGTYRLDVQLEKFNSSQLIYVTKSPMQTVVVTFPTYGKPVGVKG